MCDEKNYYVYFISLNACEHEQAENIGTVKTKTEENAEFYAADLYGLPYDDLGETWFVSEHNMGKLFLIDDFPMSVIKYQKYRTKAAARALAENRITTPAPSFEEEKKMDKKKSLVEIFNEKRQTMEFKEAYIESVKEVQADEFYKQYGQPVETVFTCGQIQEMAEYEFEEFLIRAAYGSIKEVAGEEAADVWLKDITDGAQ